MTDWHCLGLLSVCQVTHGSFSFSFLFKNGSGKLGAFRMKLVDVSGIHISSSRSSQQKKIEAGLRGALNPAYIQRQPVPSLLNHTLLVFLHTSGLVLQCAHQSLESQRLWGYKSSRCATAGLINLHIKLCWNAEGGALMFTAFFCSFYKLAKIACMKLVA